MLLRGGLGRGLLLARSSLRRPCPLHCVVSSGVVGGLTCGGEFHSPPGGGQLTIWTSPTRAVQAVCRVSVNVPSSPSAGAVQVMAQVAVAVPR